MSLNLISACEIPDLDEQHEEEPLALGENKKLIEKLENQNVNLKEFHQRFMTCKCMITNIIRKPCIEGDLRTLYKLMFELRQKICHEKSRLKNSFEESKFEKLDFEWENTRTIANHIEETLIGTMKDYEEFLAIAKSFCGGLFLLSGLLNIQRMQKIIECIKNADKYLLRLRKKSGFLRFRITVDIVIFIQRRIKKLRLSLKSKKETKTDSEKCKKNAPKQTSS